MFVAFFCVFAFFFLDRINVEQILRDSCFAYDIKIGFYLPRKKNVFRKIYRPSNCVHKLEITIPTLNILA